MIVRQGFKYWLMHVKKATPEEVFEKASVESLNANQKTTQKRSANKRLESKKIIIDPKQHSKEELSKKKHFVYTEDHFHETTPLLGTNSISKTSEQKGLILACFNQNYTQIYKNKITEVVNKVPVENLHQIFNKIHEEGKINPKQLRKLQRKLYAAFYKKRQSSYYKNVVKDWGYKLLFWWDCSKIIAKLIAKIKKKIGETKSKPGSIHKFQIPLKEDDSEITKSSETSETGSYSLQSRNPVINIHNLLHEISVNTTTDKKSGALAKKEWVYGTKLQKKKNDWRNKKTTRFFTKKIRVNQKAEREKQYAKFAEERINSFK